MSAGRRGRRALLSGLVRGLLGEEEEEEEEGSDARLNAGWVNGCGGGGW